MYLRLILIFFVFFVGEPALFAALTPGTSSNSVFTPDTSSNSALTPDTYSGSALTSETRSSPPTKPPDEVTLEANVVQIILNDEHRSGVDWGAIVSDFHRTILKKENDPAWNDKRYQLSFGTVSQDDYAVLLDALDTVGQMSQFPQSPIKVTAGTPASLSLDKQHIRIDLLLSRLKSGDLSLRIDPHVTVAATRLFNGARRPSSMLLQADTKILIADNMTVVIGGLMKEEEITREHKFPLLGDIPLVGRLVFRSQGRLMQKTETVIFMTVRTNAVEASGEDNSS